MDLLDLIFPKFCCGCQKIGSFLCSNCHEKIYFLSLEIKPKLDTIFLDKLQAMSNYDEPLKSLIHQLKYDHVKDIGKLCGQLLYCHTNFPEADLVTCTPLHKQRQHDRGYNQSEVIAEEFAKLVGLPFANIFVKNKNTQSQATLIDKSARLHNLDGAISLKHTNLPPRIIIIDDVITTGTTLNTCAKLLKESGVKQVFGLSVAHGV